jgi:hypothetical protein
VAAPMPEAAPVISTTRSVSVDFEGVMRAGDGER